MKMSIRRRMLLQVSGFPMKPAEYNSPERFDSSGEFVAGSTGWFKIELQGASGAGGTYSTYIKDTPLQNLAKQCTSGGGGGGGGCAVVSVRLNKNDRITFTIGDSGYDCTASVDSSVSDEDDRYLKVTSGGKGGNGDAQNQTVGKGGKGGNASGGDNNYNGYDGKDGVNGSPNAYLLGNAGVVPEGGAGGVSAYSDGQNGGKGGGHTGEGDVTYYYYGPQSGKKGFIRIYEGKTNVD